jgi:hypothetical protein
MGIESFPPLNNPEPHKEPIEITEEEWEKYFNTNPDLPEVAEWLKSNGIKVDSGIIDVKLDGKLVQLYTDREDFGTEVESEPIEVTEEEWEKHFSHRHDTSEFSEWLTSKGIQMDSGDITVEHDKRAFMHLSTDSIDYGKVTFRYPHWD